MARELSGRPWPAYGSVAARGSGTNARAARPRRFPLGDNRLKAVAVLGLFLGLAYASLSWVVVEFYVQEGAGPARVLAFRGSVADGLRQAGVELGEGDAVRPSLETPLANGMEVFIERAFPVTVHADGREITARLTSRTVGEILETLGVSLGPLDRVSPALAQVVTDAVDIRIVRVGTRIVKEIEAIPYETWRWAEPRWEKGKVDLLRAGRPGRQEHTIRLTYEDGKLVQREVLTTEVLEQPRPEIIGIGTKILVHTLRTPAGVIRYTDVVDMVATAYYPGPESTGKWADGLTATGVRAGHGVVAVDPKVIPLGTRLYVPGYGIALAADVGAAIKGKRIDLGFETYREAIHFGRRPVKVYILAE